MTISTALAMVAVVVSTVVIASPAVAAVANIAFNVFGAPVVIAPGSPPVGHFGVLTVLHL